MMKLLKKIVLSYVAGRHRTHGPVYGKPYGKRWKKKKAYGYGPGWPPPYGSPGYGYRPFGGGLKGLLLQALAERLQRRG